MPSPSIRSVLACATVVGATLLTPAASSAATVDTTLKAAVSELPGATEVRTGYDRSLFRHWVDADGDGCNARNEVLIEEATTRPSVGSGCALSGGRWTSYYDGASWTDPQDLDIDHMVPLAEAWDSGARTWSAAERQSYANDLGDPRSLQAVTDDVNQAKGDQDPATWEPSVAGVRCRYAAEWVAVKLRWRLTVDAAERSALSSRASGCASTRIVVQTAR
ncbi:HNH endonuclease family protein [Patulibacter sp.]|uniref:HNH endonuclease family protein n=1 Tax=Patulibacter sp. TaxID=1912859 RepID=UPI002726FA96|nr:HNH endonuclease family protein [Patulibacter sp.]MDO9408721.1 HNH endonuclease family protein [Patulibacter sp.]